MADTVWLQRPSAEIPWGFRLAGGVDQQVPLTVQRVTAGSIAATGLNKGDVIRRIADTDTTALTNAQANDVIKTCGNLLQLHISKPGSGASVGAPPPMQQQQQQPQQQPAAVVSPSSQPPRLEQQLSNMSVSDVPYPFANEPPSPAPGGPGYGAPSIRPAVNSELDSQSTAPPPPSSPEKAPPAMPDAVLNMAAKGPPEKKPWAYAPDMDSIKNQREKVRRKQPGGNLPHYQHMLNMPDFSDPPVAPHTVAAPEANNDQDASGEGVYAHAQYNSPLRMYSNDNVQESFSGQTGGQVTGAKPGGPNSPNKDIVMSPTYRFIHGLDQPKSKPKVMLPPEAAEPTPSANNSLAPQEIGNYDETSIRYRGKNIPSKSFRMLQDMTGGPMENLPAPAPKGRTRRVQHVEPPSPQQNPDDIVDISYVGGNIPSRSFRMLQQSIGDEPTAPVPAAPAPAVDGRTVRIIKLRSQPQSAPMVDEAATDF